MSTFKGLVLLGLGVTIGLLSALLFGLGARLSGQPVLAGTANSAGVITAVTGKSQRGDIDVLWVIDGEARQLACYQYGTRGIEFLGARKIWYDLKLVTYNDMSPTDVSIKRLKLLWDKANLARPKDEAPELTEPTDSGFGD